MSFAPSLRRSGHWTFTAVATGLLSPTLLLSGWWSYDAWNGCLSDHGVRLSEPSAEVPEACGGINALFALLMLITIGYVAATAITGLCVGAVEGRNRRGFGYRRWATVTIVGITAPWSLATYAVGYGLGRLVKPRARDRAWHEGRDAALRLLDQLSLGGKPAPVLAPGFLAAEPVYLDVPLHYARHYGASVTYSQTSAMAFGSAGFVAGTMLANAIGNSSAKARAQRLARPQWREHQVARVILTATRTWCNVSGRWLSFDHAAVIGYHLDDHSAILTFADSEPLRLSGPPAWAHAVLFGYFHFGGHALPTLPMLDPIRLATEDR